MISARWTITCSRKLNRVKIYAIEIQTNNVNWFTMVFVIETAHKEIKTMNIETQKCWLINLIKSVQVGK